MQPTAHPFSPALEAEIAYRLDLLIDAAAEDGDPEPVRDDATLYALFHDLETSPFWREFQREVMDWYLARGVYRVVTPAEIAATTVSHGSKARLFPRHRGQRVTFERHLEPTV
jgi:hypothetical protein